MIFVNSYLENKIWFAVYQALVYIIYRGNTLLDRALMICQELLGTGQKVNPTLFLLFWSLAGDKETNQLLLSITTITGHVCWARGMYSQRTEEVQMGLGLWVSQFEIVLNIIESFIFGLFLFG